MIITRDTMDDALGPKNTRYFGQGYQHVTHQITDLAIISELFTGTVSATAAITYPPTWSTKATRPRTAHLSAVDALAIAAQLAEAYLAHTHILDAAARARMWLPAVEMTAGSTAHTDLAAIPVHGHRIGMRIGPWGTHMIISTFEFRIGTLQVTCQVQHDLGTPARTAENWADIDHLLGGADRRPYGRGYTHRRHDIRTITVDPTQQQAGAHLDVHDTNALGWQGLAANYEPSLSLIDATICTAQLGQALAYTLEHVDRTNTGTLWMRRLRLRSSTPFLPITEPIAMSVHVTRRQRLDRLGKSWRTYHLAGDIAAIRADASLAFTIPTAPNGNPSGAAQ
ncbi:AvrD family protein [Actinophytocola sp.]|uniref:AvrD family protein n=1 Tax=Actinophytocola sp. TaxID=1872138 RepID=UPI002D810E00|nr:AvrD family protein [Actinophytocola sp.]HET9139277.1 AvrD family protein [Actinophytocola sp.]